MSEISAVPDCDAVAQELDAFVDGELPPAEHAAVERHIEGCPACRARIALARLAAAALRLAPQPEPPNALRLRLLAQVVAEGPMRRLEVLSTEHQGGRARVAARGAMVARACAFAACVATECGAHDRPADPAGAIWRRGALPGHRESFGMESTMSAVQEELAQLRQELDELKGRLPEGDSSEAFGGGTSGKVNEAVLRHLQASLEREGKNRGIAISRVVVFYDEGGTGVWSGHITVSGADQLPGGDRLRESVAALANDPLALRAARKLIEPFFEGKPMQLSKRELAAALGATEAEVEKAMLPLIADRRVRWSKSATGEEFYEPETVEPHLALLQSLE